MQPTLPDEIRRTSWGERAAAAMAAVHSAGIGLLSLRGTIRGQESAGGQLKTSVDLAAEGWVLGFLRGTFSNELFLAEEEFERAGNPWTGHEDYWTVDALDGTRSFVEGFDGFCVQVAYVAGGRPRFGVIAEPVRGHIYVGADGCGAWRVSANESTRLAASGASSVVKGLRIVDSTRPGGPVGRLFARAEAQFVECGSVGLKVCRVVEGAADLYAKRFNYKLWDVAPGEVLLREVGGAIGTWDGEAIDYAGSRTHYMTVLAAAKPLYDELVASGELSE